MATDWDLTYIAVGLRPLAVPVTSLAEDPRNARTHSRRNLDAIRASFERYGQVKPLAVRRDTMVVLAGNGRLRVAKEMGWSHVAVVMMDGTEEDMAAFAIADNRTSELAGWDDAQLAEVMAGLADTAVDLSGLGFDAAELGALVDREASVTEVGCGQDPERQAGEGAADEAAGGGAGGADGARHRSAVGADGPGGPRGGGAAADGGGAAEALALTPEQAAALSEAAHVMRLEKCRPEMSLGEVVRVLSRRYVRASAG